MSVTRDTARRQILTPPVRIWRRAVSRVTLILFCLGAVLWIYAAIRQVRGDYSYTELSAAVGRSYSAGLIVPSAIAESKLRRYLFLGAVGLFLFFAVSIGEWTI